MFGEDATCGAAGTEAPLLGALVEGVLTLGTGKTLLLLTVGCNVAVWGADVEAAGSDARVGITDGDNPSESGINGIAGDDDVLSTARCTIGALMGAVGVAALADGEEDVVLLALAAGLLTILGERCSDVEAGAGVLAACGGVAVDAVILGDAGEAASPIGVGAATSARCTDCEGVAPIGGN